MYACFVPAFTSFDELYDGISWESSFNSCNFEGNALFVKNIQEMHIGMKERKETDKEGEEVRVVDNEYLPSEDEDLDICFTAEHASDDRSVVESIFLQIDQLI